MLKFLLFDMVILFVRSILPVFRTEAKEIALLTYQVNVLKRELGKRSQFNPLDRAILASIGGSFKKFRRSCLIFTPETLLKWKRNLEKWKWTYKSKGRPKVKRDIKSLVIEMKKKNSLWGAKRIFGELKKLGIKVSVTSVRNILRNAGFDPIDKQPSLSWNEFLKRHKEVWAIDFFTVETAFMQTYYVFVIIEIHSRQLIDVAVMKSPTSNAVEQVILNSLPYRSGPDLMIRDRDPKYGKGFNKKMKELHGTKVVAVPSYSPNLNAYCERVIGSIQRECTNHFLCFNDSHLRQIVSSYKKYYNKQRPHQGISQKIPGKPDGNTGDDVCSPASVKSEKVLGGLHHHYFRAA